MKKILKEELNRINELMGTKKLVMEASNPIPALSAYVKTFLDDAARMGKVFRGDATEISAALASLKVATTVADQLSSIARLMKASDELFDVLIPSIVRTVKTMQGGDRFLDGLDDYVVRMRGQGYSDYMIMTEIEKSIDAALPSNVEGLKDILKMKYRKDLAKTGDLVVDYLPVIPGTNTRLPSTPKSGPQIVKELRAIFAANPKAKKIIDQAEQTLKDFTPNSESDALRILENNKKQIETLLDIPGDPKKWDWLKGEVKSNWATKRVMGFFIALGVMSIFSVLMKVGGFNLFSPVCMFIDASFNGGLTCEKIAERMGWNKSEDAPITPSDVESKY